MLDARANDGRFDVELFVPSSDPNEVGTWRLVPPTNANVLGQFATLTPLTYHRITARHDKVMAVEVSLVNDDDRDNRFLEKVGADENAAARKLSWLEEAAS